ncbi:hypothetical protein N9233_01345 [Flavobacteriales bacterium]|nr:hypothetical protein [Flavobacteriales bacterium]
MKYLLSIVLLGLFTSFVAEDPCSDADKYQAEYLKTQSAVSYGLFMHNTALCFGTESTVDMDACRRAETHRLNYMKSFKPSDMNKYMTELETCMMKKK